MQKLKRFITVKHTRLIEEHTKGIFHHEGHEEHEEDLKTRTNTLGSIEPVNDFKRLSFFVSFVVRTMGWEEDANHESMLHREEPLKKSHLRESGGPEVHEETGFEAFVGMTSKEFCNYL
ncbi:MAG: hypothetical protein ABSA71_08080 [Desulfomonilia bacterium]